MTREALQRLAAMTWSEMSLGNIAKPGNAVAATAAILKALEQAELAGFKRGVEAAAEICKLVCKEHRETKRYPIEMWGLATECEARIRALLDDEASK